MTSRLKVQKVSEESLAYRNCAFVGGGTLARNTNLYDLVVANKRFPLYVEENKSVKSGCLALTLFQRKWCQVNLDEDYSVCPCNIPKNTYVCRASVSVDFLQKSRSSVECIDSDELHDSFVKQFQNYPVSVQQMFAFKPNNKCPPLLATFLEIQVANISDFMNDPKNLSGSQSGSGIILQQTQIIFKKADGSIVNLVGGSKDPTVSATTLISPNWDFNQMGIGGLDKEFSAIFRRAFASRLFPPDVIHQFGLKHVRGILLFGPPGTGKTLMARQIGKMLNAREPKIVNGPEILNKYVGESEANVRKLFEEAEQDQKKFGISSNLHIIIFDEIDAICKQRGTTGGSTGVHDTVVNQLLAKIDGVDQLNNILIIGMTNRKDLIDEALLRPGRLEVQMEISLPDETGRSQILGIHTSQLRRHNKIDKSVNLGTLAHITKNFSGAELEGLVRAATTTAMNRMVKVDGKVHIDPMAMDKLVITMDDFEYSLQNDVKPSFGASTEDLSLNISKGIVIWCDSISNILADGSLMIEQTRNSGLISPVSVLLEGLSCSGKTALASQLAIGCNFPLIKLCSADQMVGFTELAKCHYLKKMFDDAAKSELSCIVIDDVERILEYVSIGPRFSNSVLQTLLVLLNKRFPRERRLLVIATTSCPAVMEEMGVTNAFSRILTIPCITSVSHVEKINSHYSFFKSPSDWSTVSSGISDMRLSLPVKKLLGMFELSMQAEDSCAEKFVELLSEQCGM